jgi:hypothetical protein
MKRNSAKSACLFFFLTLVQAWAAEPLVGSWHMTSQQFGGAKAPATPLDLKVSEVNGALQFAYSMNGGQLITMTFAARLDGTEVDVKNGAGAKIGTVKVTRSSSAVYNVVLKSLNQPPSPGKMTVSDGGKTLTCESDTALPGKGVTHVVQVFARQ